MRPTNERERVGPRYRIGKVAELTGLTTHAIRVWERRYKVVAPRRSDGGERLYSDDDVLKLGLLRRLSALGHPIGTVAHMPVEELSRLTGPAIADATIPPVTTALSDRVGGAALVELQRRFVESVVALDVAGASEMLGRAALLLPLRELLGSVVSPIVREIGDRWERGEITIAHEHAASALLRNLLGSLLRPYVADSDAPVAIATTLAGERHELGALMVALLAASHGWRSVYLGPDLPADQITASVEQYGAELLLISLAMASTADARREVRRILDGLPRTTRVVVGGTGAATYGAAVRGATVLADLASLDAELRRGR